MKFSSLNSLISAVFLLMMIPVSAQFRNFRKDGKQLLRFDLVGNAVDAHDGEIAHFNGVYYLYGTSYDCGFEWGRKDAPFCGFKSYSSSDLIYWKDEGYLFDATSTLWQERCNGNTYGCFRPHVVYNSSTKKYVLWINVYDNVIGYRVFTSDSPVGPFTEQKEPMLAVNNDKPAKGLNNGDHDLFVDDDGTCYLAFTDWREKGSIVIEKLDKDYLNGTGELVKAVTTNKTEAPGLFKRNGVYYMTYSDPNCGYCSGTGTSYKTAKSPLGPWSEPIKISENSCGGQPSFVSTVKINNEVVYIYGSDLWNNAAKNEALGNYYWAPLQFNKDGSIKPLVCKEEYKKIRVANAPGQTTEGYSWKCGITDTTDLVYPLSISSQGRLEEMKLLMFAAQQPEEPLEMAIIEKPSGRPVWEKKVHEQQFGWSPSVMKFEPDFVVNKGSSYVLVMGTTAKKGCYGFAVDEKGKLDLGLKVRD